MVSTNGTGLKEESVKEQRLRRRRDARTEMHRQRQNHEALLTEFQPDAVEIENRPVPGGARWTLYIVVGMICSAVAWASWAEVDRIVTAQGVLITIEPMVVIDSKLTSPISSMNAKFGDHVSAGFLIATQDPTFTDADLNQLKSKQASLVAVIARLTAERDGKPFSIEGRENERDWLMQSQVFMERQKEYAAEIRKVEAQQSAFDVQQANLKLEIASNREALKMYKDLEESYIKLQKQRSKSMTDIISRKLQSNEAEMKVQSGISRDQEITKSSESLWAELDVYKAAYATQIAVELVTNNDNYTGVEQELNKAVRSNQFVELRVPSNLPYKEFVVFEVAEKSVGTIMQPGEALFKLVPVGVPLEAEINIEGRDIARVTSATAAQIESGDLPGGSDVRLKLASFPYQKHGALHGVIRAISEGSFEQELPNGAASGVTAYRARVQIIDPEALLQVPDNFRLMPGMTVTAEIKVGRRRVIEYFLYPLIRAAEALREP